MSLSSEWAEWVNSWGPQTVEWVPPSSSDVGAEMASIKRRYGEDISPTGNWNKPSSTLDAARKTQELASEMRSAIAKKFLLSKSYLEQYIAPSSPEFVCASVFRQLGRLEDRMGVFANELSRYIDQNGDTFYPQGDEFVNFSVEGNRTFARKVENFWGENIGTQLDDQGRQIWQPEAVYPFAAMNWCATEIKAKSDATSELRGGDAGNKRPSHNPFLYFFTSPIGLGVIALSGVLVARKLTR